MIPSDLSFAEIKINLPTRNIQVHRVFILPEHNFWAGRQQGIQICLVLWNNLNEFNFAILWFSKDSLHYCETFIFFIEGPTFHPFSKIALNECKLAGTASKQCARLSKLFSIHINKTFCTMLSFQMDINNSFIWGLHSIPFVEDASHRRDKQVLRCPTEWVLTMKVLVFPKVVLMVQVHKHLEPQASIFHTKLSWWCEYHLCLTFSEQGKHSEHFCPTSLANVAEEWHPNRKTGTLLMGPQYSVVEIAEFQISQTINSVNPFWSQTPNIVESLSLCSVPLVLTLILSNEKTRLITHWHCVLVRNVSLKWCFHSDKDVLKMVPRSVYLLTLFRAWVQRILHFWVWQPVECNCCLSDRSHLLHLLQPNKTTVVSALFSRNKSQSITTVTVSRNIFCFFGDIFKTKDLGWFLSCGCHPPQILWQFLLVVIDLLTFFQHSESTAGSLGILRQTVIIIPMSPADSVTIDPELKYSPIPFIQQQIGREVVVPSSTRGNCEHPCCWVVPTEIVGLTISRGDQLPFHITQLGSTFARWCQSFTVQFKDA